MAARVQPSVVPRAQNRGSRPLSHDADALDGRRTLAGPERGEVAVLPVRVIAGTALLLGVLVSAAVADVLQGTDEPDTIVGTPEDDDIHG